MKPESDLIVAVQRKQTGADVHILNNLLHQYVCACHTKNDALAARAKHQLMAALISKRMETQPGMSHEDDF
jgi:hypothetical protein